MTKTHKPQKPFRQVPRCKNMWPTWSAPPRQPGRLPALQCSKQNRGACGLRSLSETAGSVWLYATRQAMKSRPRNG